jgi:hypothetical protein
VAIRNRLAAERDSARKALDVTTRRVSAAVTARSATETSDRRRHVEDLQQRIRSTETLRDKETQDHATAVDADEGILARLEALERLERSSDAMQLAHRMLFLLLTLIECLPILVKSILLIMPPTTYERLLELEDARTVAEADLELDLQRYEQQHRARLRVEFLAARARTQLRAEEEAASAVFDAQISLVKKSLERWREAEEAAMKPRTVDDTTQIPTPAPQPARIATSSRRGA